VPGLSETAQPGPSGAASTGPRLCSGCAGWPSGLLRPTSRPRRTSTSSPSTSTRRRSDQETSSAPYGDEQLCPGCRFLDRAALTPGPAGRRRPRAWGAGRGDHRLRRAGSRCPSPGGGRSSRSDRSAARRRTCAPLSVCAGPARPSASVASASARWLVAPVGARGELVLVVWWPCGHCASRVGRSEPGSTLGPHGIHADAMDAVRGSVVRVGLQRRGRRCHLAPLRAPERRLCPGVCRRGCGATRPREGAAGGALALAPLSSATPPPEQLRPRHRAPQVRNPTQIQQPPRGLGCGAHR